MTRGRWWVLALVIAALALAASANSVHNQFAYDDLYLIVKSARMHSMAGWWREFAHTYWPEASGGDGYRPLTIISFRAEWAIGGGSALPFHVVNIVLHVVTAVAVFWLACAVLPLAAAWIAAALYAVHPVHTEAVANVVGQSELFDVLWVTLAVALYLHGRRAGRLTWTRWLGIGGLYALGLMFKEHAIVMPALLLVADFTVVRDATPARQRVAMLRLPMLSLAVVALLYMWARSRVVVGGLSGFEPFIVFSAVRLSTADRILTMIGAAPEWLRLFLWPARLMTEYTPQYIDVAQGPTITQLPGLLVLLGTLGLVAATWRRSPPTAFGISWLVLTLLPGSNFIVPAGFIIAERTLLLPSVGVVIAIASIVPWVYERVESKPALQAAAAAALVVLLALGIARSVTRNEAWHDNGTLFRAAIRDSPQSYRAHFMLAVHLAENRQWPEAEYQFWSAIRLFPYDHLAVYSLADLYRSQGMCDKALVQYRWLMVLQPEWGRAHLNYATCLLATGDPDGARAQALLALRYGTSLRYVRPVLEAVAAARGK